MCVKFHGNRFTLLGMVNIQTNRFTLNIVIEFYYFSKFFESKSIKVYNNLQYCSFMCVRFHENGFTRLDRDNIQTNPFTTQYSD